MRHDRGFSLIELMIAITLGMLAVAAVGSVFIYGSRSYKEDDKIARMQDELRFAMAQLTLDLEMAGFVAQVRDPLQDVDIDGSVLAAPAVWPPSDCGPSTDGAVATAATNWVYQERRAFIATRGDVSGVEAKATFPCINDKTFQPGTDVIAIKRLGGAEITGTLEPSRIYLRTNGLQTTIHLGSATPSPTGANVTVYEYRPVIWYVRNWSVTEGDGIPSLCRKVLVPAGMQDDLAGCVAQGIEDLQLEFGFDRGPEVPLPKRDGAVDFFVEYKTVDVPSPANLAEIVTVRVHLLARSLQADPGYKNVKSYTLGSKVIAANDSYYRKTLSSVVVMRNAAYRLSPFALPQ